MELAKTRVQVIEKMIENTIQSQVSMEVGLEIKELMMIQMANHPALPKVEKAAEEERAELQSLPKVLEILQRKLKEAKEQAK